MMIRVLFWLMAVGAIVGCQVEDTEPTSGILNVDPNNDTVVPEGVTVDDVDLNNDGTIDITDLMIVSKFFGQDVSTEEEVEVVAESCPAGEFRKPIFSDRNWSDTNYVGFDRQVAATYFSGGEKIVKLRGKFEDKRKDSCDYLYPDTYSMELQRLYINRSFAVGIDHPDPPDSTCLIHCNPPGLAVNYMLCRARPKIVGYTECFKCPQPVNKSGDLSYLPTKTFTEFVQSDDPTQCRHSGEVDRQYLFPHSNGIDFYTYTYLNMNAYYPNPFWSPNNENDPERSPLGRRTRTRFTDTLVRLLVTPDKDNRIKELTVITTPYDYFSSSADKTLSPYTFKLKREPDPIRGYSYDRYISTDNKSVEILIQNDDADLENMGHPVFPTRPNVYTNTPDDRVSHTDSFLDRADAGKIPIRGGIQVGEPSKIVDDKSNSSVVAIYFKHKNEEYRWGVYDTTGFRFANSVHKFPEEVRNKYLAKKVDPKGFYHYRFTPEE